MIQDGFMLVVVLIFSAVSKDIWCMEMCVVLLNCVRLIGTRKSPLGLFTKNLQQRYHTNWAKILHSVRLVIVIEAISLCVLKQFSCE